jgi:hypothetical protein
MKSFLVVGLEASCTKYVSRLIALNLGLVSDPLDWDGHDKVSNKKYLVAHKSLPHGYRNNFVKEDYYKSFDFVVVAVRDLYCSFISKIKTHQQDMKSAVLEHEIGRKVLGEILQKANKVKTYSYESAFVIGKPYNDSFLKSLGIKPIKDIVIEDINRKYIKYPF